MSPESEFERILEEILNRRAAGEHPTLEDTSPSIRSSRGRSASSSETLRVLED